MGKKLISFHTIKARNIMYYETKNPKSFIFNKATLKLVLTILSAICLGAIIFVVGGLPYKWIFILILSGVFLIFVIAIGSLERALQALLIFSLSTIMDVSLGWSHTYATLKPGIPITLTSIILIALYSLLLVRVSLRKELVQLFPSITIPFALIILWSGLSFIIAANSAYVLAGFPRLLTGFFLFIYTANFLKTREDILYVIKCVAITITFSGILGILQYISGPFPFLAFLGARKFQVIMGYSDISISRVSGLFGHPNNFAHLMVAFLPLMFVCAIAVTGFGLRVLCSFSFALGLMSLVLTFSRNGWLSFVTSLLVIAIFLLKRKRQKRLRGAQVRLIILGMIAIVLIAPYFSQIITRLTRDDYGAAYSRIPQAHTALKIIATKPITGVGFGNYKFAVVPYLDEYGDIIGGQVLHNMFLLITAELGLPAFAMFLWISILLFKQGVRAIASADKLKNLFALGLLAGFAGVYLYGMFEDVFFGDPRFVSLSAIGGLLVAIRYYVIPNTSKRELTDI